MRLADTLREISGSALVDEDGNDYTLELLPPATEEEIAELEAALSLPLPDELREALAVTAGLASGPVESLGFLDVEGFGMEDVFPEAFPLAHDGFGNYWVLDLLPDGDECGPVFYACHDPPVIAFQSESASAFVRDVIAMGQPGARSPVDIVHEDVTFEIWGSAAGLMSQEEASDSADGVLVEFAASFPPEAVFADLRVLSVGAGFPWGRFGPRTEWTRAGTHRLWAAVPPQRRGLLSRLFG